jgi:3-oxoacyl-(acyl-carrier-protein) synthase
VRRESSIVVTGMGLVSPFGDSLDDFWGAISDGEVATGDLTRFDTSVLSATRGAEIPGAGAEPGEGPLTVRWATRAAEFAVVDAELTPGAIPADRGGVCFGTVMGTRSGIEQWLLDPNAGRSTARASAACGWDDPPLLSRAPARRLCFDGPNCVVATACAAGNSAIAWGAETLRRNQADAMVVGGADEISQATLLVFDSFRSLAPDCVRPFDAERRGLLLGEGAAALVLEREDDARARGVSIYGRILGHSNVGDAYHMTAPHPEGRGAIVSMRRALTEAGVSPSEVDHVSAHGTGTAANDRAEALAVREVLGAYTNEVPVTALKSMLGHAQGAASAIEAVACLLTMKHGLIPPIANYATPDPACDLDVVTGAARPASVDIAISNAFGFWGNIECVVLGAA